MNAADRIRTSCLIFIFGFLLLGSVNGQVSYSDQAVRAALELNFKQADSLLSHSSEDIHSVSWIRSQSFQEFLKVLLRQNDAGYRHFCIAMEQWLNGLNKLPDFTLGRDAAKCEIWLYKAVLSSQFSDYQKSAWSTYTAWKIYKHHQSGMTPGERDKFAGILLLIFEQVPNQYHQYLKILGIRTEGADGLVLLQRYYRSALPGSLEQLEGVLLLLSAANGFNKHPDEIDLWIQEGVAGMPSNILVDYLIALYLLKSGNNESALQHLLEHTAPDPHLFPYWYYQVGRMKLYRHDRDASVWLEQFLRSGKDLNLHKSAWQKLSWYHLLSAQTEAYYIDRQQVLNEGPSVHPADAEAVDEVTGGQSEDPRRVALRILFDGGYYRLCIHKGMAALQVITEPVIRAEVHYRLARSFQQIKDYPSALVHFQKVIDARQFVDQYWLPNSALQMGLMYLDMHQLEQAHKYLRLCLKLNHYGYRQGIRREAETALRRID